MEYCEQLSCVYTRYSYEEPPYAHNRPSRWVDILGLRPGDVFYSLEDAILDASSYIFDLAGPNNKVEWGTGFKYVSQPYFDQEEVCINAYTYGEVYSGTENDWSPYRSMFEEGGACEKIVFMHLHLPGYGITPNDIFMSTFEVPKWCKNYLFSIILTSDRQFIGIDIKGNVCNIFDK